MDREYRIPTRSRRELRHDARAERLPVSCAELGLDEPDPSAGFRSDEGSLTLQEIERHVQRGCPDRLRALYETIYSAEKGLWPLYEEAREIMRTLPPLPPTEEERWTDYDDEDEFGRLRI